LLCFFFFFFNDTATTEIYTLSLHDALPIWSGKVVDSAQNDKNTEGIRTFNKRLFSLEEFRSVIVPLRDGVAIARRVE